MGSQITKQRQGMALAAALSLALIAAAAGCDWVQGSDTGQRASPFISDINVSPAVVLCGESKTFTVSFRFDDPQADIFEGTATFQYGSDSNLTEEKLSWEHYLGLTSGTASFPFFFTCDKPGGLWTITVQIKDERGHPSNTLSARVTLNKAG